MLSLSDYCFAGSFFTIQAAARQMKKRHIRGSIAIVASMSGSIANKGERSGETQYDRST